MAKIQWTDPTWEWDVVNSGPVQRDMAAVAKRGVRIGKALAAEHFQTGELEVGIKTGTEGVSRGKVPVTDHVVIFEHEAMSALEYGHVMSGMYGHGTNQGLVEGIFVANDTLKGLGG